MEQKSLHRSKGWSINDVGIFRGKGGQGFCDEITKVLVLKRVTMGREGV